MASDTALHFAQLDAGVPPLHAVRLPELSAVLFEEGKEAVEEARGAQAGGGDPDAAAALGELRYFGTGYTGSGSRRKDMAEAASLFDKAARKDNPLSLNNMGVMLLNGVGVERNETKAFELFARSAELGNPYGINSLAVPPPPRAHTLRGDLLFV